VAYHVLEFVLVKDWNYLYYALLVSALAAYQGSLAGVLNQYAWPSSPRFALWSVHVSGMMALVFGAIYVRSSLKDWVDVWLLDRWIGFTILGAVTLLGLAFVKLIHIGTLVTTLGTLAVVSDLTLIAICVACWRQGSKGARDFLVAWSLALLAMV